jgi:hypothetical protein
MADVVEAPNRPYRRGTARTARTAHAGRVAAVTVTALAAALVQPLAARADTPPPPPSDAELAAEPARHDDTREQFYFVLRTVSPMAAPPTTRAA